MTSANEIIDAAREKTGQRIDPAETHRLAVAEEVARLRVRSDARASFDAALRAAVQVPSFDADLLADVLTRPAEPPHRVEGLIPSDGGTLVVAQRKTGKTTLQLNLARSLLTGEMFLGRFPVRPITGRVALLNFEVSGAQLGRWAADAGVPADRLFLVNLRGRRNPLSHAEDRDKLAELLRAQQVESLIVDPFGRAYSGQSQNDPGEVGAWLAELDRFARGDVGVSDLILAAHAGWDGERTRGASALEDWADSIITVVRDKDDDSIRYLRATGRDVEVEEDRLTFDPVTRRLSMSGSGSRKTAAAGRKIADLIPAVVEIVTATPGINGSQVAEGLKSAGVPHQRGDERKAIREALAAGRIRCEKGKRNAQHYFPGSELPRATPSYPGGASLSYPEPRIYNGVAQRGSSSPSYPAQEAPRPAEWIEQTTADLTGTGDPPTCDRCPQALMNDTSKAAGRCRPCRDDAERDAA